MDKYVNKTIDYSLNNLNEVQIFFIWQFRNECSQFIKLTYKFVPPFKKNKIPLDLDLLPVHYFDMFYHEIIVIFNLSRFNYILFIFGFARKVTKNSKTVHIVTRPLVDMSIQKDTLLLNIKGKRQSVIPTGHIAIRHKR